MKRGKARRTDLLGDGLTALCGGALALNLLFVVGLLAILASNQSAPLRPRVAAVAAAQQCQLAAGAPLRAHYPAMHVRS